jgi:hypothetical protein
VYPVVYGEGIIGAELKSNNYWCGVAVTGWYIWYINNQPVTPTTSTPPYAGYPLVWTRIVSPGTFIGSCYAGNRTMTVQEESFLINLFSLKGFLYRNLQTLSKLVNLHIKAEHQIIVRFRLFLL